MPASRQPYDGYLAALAGHNKIDDPGSGGTITATKSPCVCNLTTAAAEARTVDDPVGPGQILVLTLVSDGGDCTLTFSSPYNIDGDTVLVLDDANDSVVCVSIEDGTSAFRWLRISGASDTARVVSVGDADYTVLPTNSGKPHLVANVSADRTITLPSPQNGLDFEFIANAVVADGHDWIFDTGSNTNYFTGGVEHLDTDAGSAGDEVVPVRPDGNSNSKLQINLPDVGTKVRFISDGTLWNVSGEVYSTTAPTFADQ